MRGEVAMASVPFAAEKNSIQGVLFDDKITNYLRQLPPALASQRRTGGI